MCRYRRKERAQRKARTVITHVSIACILKTEPGEWFLSVRCHTPPSSGSAELLKILTLLESLTEARYPGEQILRAREERRREWMRILGAAEIESHSRLAGLPSGPSVQVTAICSCGFFPKGLSQTVRLC